MLHSIPPPSFIPAPPTEPLSSLPTMGSLPAHGRLDALIVGAGFGGAYQLKRLRDEGYHVRLVDSATDFGGVWYWNRYPGARVDSGVPHYEFSDPDLWKEWTWKQRFPGGEELRDYFSFVAQKWDLRKDTDFETYVSRATWDEDTATWTVEAKNGRVYRTKFLLLNTGFAAKRYLPDWEGIDKFKGTWLHPSYWPKVEPDLKGKKIAVIGTGSSGVQLAQSLSQVASEFTLFQRTPNMALPMNQVNYAEDGKSLSDERYEKVFAGRYNSFGGFDFNFYPRGTFEDTPEQREAKYEELWKHGDFHFWLANYQDMLFTADANKEAYDFWKRKVRARINDPRLKELLAPDVQPHSFGCKRISLENGFYEIFNQPNVSLVDMNSTPVVQVTERGIKTTDREYEFDYVICATGFDAVTGGLMKIDIQGRSGMNLAKKWKNGAKTYLGMSVADFPNMLFTYGPQAPTALCNGPTCAESQGEFIVKVMNHMAEHGIDSIDARADAEEKWVQDIQNFANATLLPSTKSVSEHLPSSFCICTV